jgi:hypothetical protein
MPIVAPTRFDVDDSGSSPAMDVALSTTSPCPLLCRSPDARQLFPQLEGSPTLLTDPKASHWVECHRFRQKSVNTGLIRLMVAGLHGRAAHGMPVVGENGIVC